MASGFQDALVPQVVRKSVSTTAVQISTTAQLVYTWTIEASSANTSVLYLGTSAVANTLGIHLAAGDTFTAPVIYAGGSNPREYDLSEWYIRGGAASNISYILKIRKASQV